MWHSYTMKTAALKEPIINPTLQQAEGCRNNKSHSFSILSAAFQPCAAFFPLISYTVCYGLLCQKEIILHCRGKKTKICKLNVCQNTNLFIQKRTEVPVVISSFECAKAYLCVWRSALYVPCTACVSEKLYCFTCIV